MKKTITILILAIVMTLNCITISSVYALGLPGQDMDMDGHGLSTSSDDDGFLDELPPGEAPDVGTQETQTNPHDVEGIDDVEDETAGDEDKDGKTEDETAGEDDELGTESTGDDDDNNDPSLKNTNMPLIPKPDVLVGPEEGLDQGGIQNYFRERAIPNFVAAFIGIIGLMAFLSLVISGIMFLTAYGNEERVTAAKKTAIYAAIGFILAILSYAIVSIISSLDLGTNLLNADIAFAEGDDQAIEDHTNMLLPGEDELISNSPNAQGVSLPEGSLALDIIPDIVRILLLIASTVMFAALFYAGILLLVARGKEEDINKAQDIIIYAIIGIIIIALSYALVYGISQLQIAS